MTDQILQYVVYFWEIVAGAFIIWAFWKLLSKAETDYTTGKLGNMPRYDFDKELTKSILKKQ